LFWKPDIVTEVLTNEKRGGLNLVSFDWSHFQLFKLKFSKESVQTAWRAGLKAKLEGQRAEDIVSEA
jgi:hypothetical protein